MTKTIIYDNVTFLLLLNKKKNESHQELKLSMLYILETINI